MCHASETATIPHSWTRALSRERSIIQVLDGLPFLPRPGDQSGPRSVSEDVLSLTEGVVSAQSAVELERLGRASRVRSHGRAPGWDTVKVLTSQYLRSHSPGLCPGRDWNPGPSKDPTARAVGFNHCPGRSGQNLVDISCLFYPVPWCKIFSI